VTVTERQPVRTSDHLPTSVDAVIGQREYAALAAVAAVVFGLAYDNGAYSIQSRSIVAIVAWWLVVLAIIAGIYPLARLAREAVVVTAALAAFAILSLASIGWAANDANAFAEFNRVSLYVAVLLLAFVVSSRRTVGRCCDGILVGIGAVVALSLVSRLFPDAINTTSGFRFLPRGLARLNYPLGYWNGLAVFIAMAVPLALRSALLGGSRVTRALAISPIPAFAAAIYLSSSRTGAAAAVLGVFAFFVLVRRRVAALAALAAAAIGCAPALATVASVHAVAEGTAVSRGQGLLVALVVLASCCLAGLALAPLSSLEPRLSSRSRSIERLPLVGMVIVVVAAVVAAHPVRRFHDFQQLPAAYGADGRYVRSHLLNSSGNGRWQYWTAAVREFEAHPAAGGGAGSYQAWWEKTRPYPAPLRNAHSLYLEVLGELGVIGLLLVVIVFAGGFAAVALRLRRGDDAHRTTVAGLGAVLVVFAVAAAFDWFWQLTVVTIVAVLCLGFLAGPATAGARPARRARWLVPAAGAAVVVLALPAIGSQAIALLADRRLAASEHAFATGHLRGAFDAANDSRNLEPWADGSYLQLALVAERAGDLSSARAWIADAIRRNPDNWTTWVVQSRIQTKAGAPAAGQLSLARAHDLNPLGLAQAVR
jgi:O-Antigen ligase